MANMEFLENRTRELYQTCRKAAEDLENDGEGVSNYLPDGNAVETMNLCYNLYLLYVAVADGKVEEKELKLINSLMDTHMDAKSCQLLLDKAGIRRKDFIEQTPVILLAFVDADNQPERRENKEAICLSLYELLATAGVYVMVANEQITNDEYDAILKYLSLVHHYILFSLRKGVSELKKPEEMIAQVLSDSDMELNINLKKRNKKKEAEKETGKESAKEDEEDSTTFEELMDQLNSMIGLDEVKFDVISQINLQRIKTKREGMGLEMPPLSRHLVFYGNPGTGKTTVARLLSQIYKKIGTLSQGQLVETDRAGLVAGYVGQTAIKTQQVIEEAKGGVLFIDEAYSLTPEDSPSDYGREAVDTLVKAMEDYRDDLVVIVAGYPEKMEHFLDSNPGLKSRFNKFINFQDYTPEELTKIFDKYCEDSDYRASKPALEYVRQYYEDLLVTKPENFGNARDVRNLFENAMNRQASRVLLINNPTPNDMTLITRADVAGESADLGRQQYLAQQVLNTLNRPCRHGIYADQEGMLLDELEFSASTCEALGDNQISTVHQILDYIDSGKKLTDLPGMSEGAAKELMTGLESLGYVA